MSHPLFKLTREANVGRWRAVVGSARVFADCLAIAAQRCAPNRFPPSAPLGCRGVGLAAPRRYGRTEVDQRTRNEGFLDISHLALRARFGAKLNEVAYSDATDLRISRSAPPVGSRQKMAVFGAPRATS